MHQKCWYQKTDCYNPIKNKANKVTKPLNFEWLCFLLYIKPSKNLCYSAVTLLLAAIFEFLIGKHTVNDTVHGLLVFRFQLFIILTRSLTAFGYPRYSRRFWRQMLDKNPEMFDASNRNLIKAGRSPVVNEQWVKYYKTHSAYMDDELMHHHVNQGSMAVGIPKKVHLDFFKELHPFLKGIKGIALSLTGAFIDFAGTVVYSQ